MRATPTRILGTAAVVLMLVGTVLAIVFAVLQSSCDNSVVQTGIPVVPHAAKCKGYGVGAGIGVGVLAVGALLVGLAGLSSTALFRRRRRERPQSEAKDPAPIEEDPPPDDPAEGQFNG
jgi:hypothetical protein